MVKNKSYKWQANGRQKHLEINSGCLSKCMFFLQIALKCADISNPCRTWELSKQWSEKVTQEFFHQGIFEAE